ncbi:hypothetical protein H257_15104 [Aphanomyces astaci]|uniref:Uncharacterized protein n=1 Tax=Aphanomyces astaci TaxID=112090 RepID=W4FR77_APHAT|nr:hypothetical protein H257_15104 [Aphanomyces astaci]ETV69148.1 hypothetical protein H257_15104 [Aphanomyces astaci]|eukprot:XP_009841401.1 hypothetical protein H257_15104 [Aphanomyces astaci]
MSSQPPAIIDRQPWLHRVLLLWLDPLFRLGATRPLVDSDIWHLGAQDTAVRLSRRFARHWGTAHDRRPSSLVRDICRTFAREMTVVTTLSVAYSLLVQYQPPLIHLLMTVVTRSDDTIDDTSGYWYAALLAVVSLVSVTILDSSFFVTAQLATNVKTVVMDLVLSQSLHCPDAATSSGDVITMVAVDSTRLFVGFVALPWLVVPVVTLPLLYTAIGSMMGWQVGVAGGLTLLVVMAGGYYFAHAAGNLRHDLMAAQAARVKATDELLAGIRVVKMYGWEASLENRVTSLRDAELALQHTYQFGSELNAIGLLVAPTLSLMACVVVYVVGLGHALTPTVAFTAMAYVNIARLPCNLFAFAVMRVTEAVTSAHRIEAFIRSSPATIPSAASTTSTSSTTSIADDDMVAEAVVDMHEASFASTNQPRVDPLTPPPSSSRSACILHQLNLTILQHQLTMIVGPVGSGKSSVLKAILGELELVAGHMEATTTRVAYASQEPWLQQTTIRSNITFQSDNANISDHYATVLSACQLLPDLASFPQGDCTVLGDRGVNLSGGQRARVALARAMYRQDADLVLLDDPLSALDSHVAKTVFEQGIRGVLAEKSVILVLNSHYHLLPFADTIVVMEGGRVVRQGSFATMQQHLTSLSYPQTSKTCPPPTTLADQLRPLASPNPTSTSSPVRTANPLKTRPPVDESSPLLVVAPTSDVALDTYVAYFDASGWHGISVMAGVGGMYLLSQGVVVAADAALTSVTTFCLYVALAVAAMLLLFTRGICALLLNLACAKTLHRQLLHAVVSAPVPTFFDVTPLGRILHRFTSDLFDVDSRMPTSAVYLLQCQFQVLGIAVVCGAALPCSIVFCAPLTLLVTRIYTRFSHTSPALTRLAAAHRAPFVAFATETLRGLSTIRAFDQTEHFETNGRRLLDKAQSYLLVQFLASRWLQMRMDGLSAGMVAAVAFCCVWSRATVGVVGAGLALTYVTQLSGFLSRAVMGHAEVAEHMTSVERMVEYIGIKSEGAKSEGPVGGSRSTTALAEWPSQGAVTFANYSMRYRAGLELSLKHVSLSVRGGEKVGICGRTGGGKSSLLAALFRTVEAASGRIMIDGVDIATVDLATLRSRLTIIPQDPVVFSGSVRFNLDPTLTTDDAELWHVLRQVHLADVVGLDYDVAEHGANLSGGQRQLLCIARALLRKSKVVVLDEATANIDGDTDRLIQDTLRANFHHDNVTKLVIAHRVHTILDSDRILVLQDGSVVEFDTPVALLAIENGVFKALAAHAGATLP